MQQLLWCGRTYLRIIRASHSLRGPSFQMISTPWHVVHILALYVRVVPSSLTNVSLSFSRSNS